MIAELTFIGAALIAVFLAIYTVIFTFSHPSKQAIQEAITLLLWSAMFVQGLLLVILHKFIQTA